MDPEGTQVNFDGKISLKTFDSRRDVTYVTKFGSKISYKMPGNPIFRGSGSVENGKFALQFIVPKDISYGGSTGRISLYFNDSSNEGAGYRDNLIVDGTATNLIDSEGPDIEFESRDQTLIDFAVLNSGDVINIIIADDKSGINITGDVGHKITAIPDENSMNQKEITDLFEYKTNSYLDGSIRMPLSIFSEFSETGNKMHQLTIKAWDNANNSSQKNIRFEIVPDGSLILKDVLNYPNPFFQSTTFTFYLISEAQVSVKIYTLAGRLISRIENISGLFGFNMIHWDGLDQDGDPVANGVYLYKIQAKNADQSVEYIGKLIKME